jgi:hypothetical protein
MVEIDAHWSSLVRAAVKLLFSENAFGRLRQYVEEVADYAEIGDIKEGRFRIFIDHDDCLGSLHASAVLDCARDSARNIELRADCLSGLANLM